METNSCLKRDKLMENQQFHKLKRIKVSSFYISKYSIDSKARGNSGSKKKAGRGSVDDMSIEDLEA